MITKFLTREEYHKQKWDKKVFWKDDCPFCKKGLNKWHTIWEWKHWYILHNTSPYSWNEKHIMAVPYEHIQFSTDLKAKHFQDLQVIHKFVKNFFKEDQYFSFTRESMANRSVEHLHIHFLAWKLQWKYIRKMLQNQGFTVEQELEV